MFFNIAVLPLIASLAGSAIAAPLMARHQTEVLTNTTEGAELLAISTEALNGTLGVAAGEPEAFPASVASALATFPASTMKAAAPQLRESCFVTVPAAIKTAAAINGTTDPFMSLTSEVLGGEWPGGFKTALSGLPAAAQQEMAAAMLQSLGPLLEAVIPVVHASAGAGAQQALGTSLSSIASALSSQLPVGVAHTSKMNRTKRTQFPTQRSKPELNGRLLCVNQYIPHCAPDAGAG
ncbi:hypothetical protein FB451DRAFT_1194917 [Mycena latifolia]|nr:hypothetical protein FB451DRAFT_1194917 [Mycena latifolia]